MASVLLHFEQKTQDYHLALFVGILIIVDALILFVYIYTAVEGSRGTLGPTKTEHTENPSDVRGVRYLIVVQLTIAFLSTAVCLHAYMSFTIYSFAYI